MQAAVAEDLHRLRVRVGHARHEAEARRHQLRGVIDKPPRTLVDGPAELVQRVRHRRVEQLRRGPAVVLEGPEADVGAVGDGLDARAGVPMRGWSSRAARIRALRVPACRHSERLRGGAGVGVGRAQQ